MKKIGIVVGVIIAIIIAAAVHFGLFHKIEISSEEKGPYYLVYKIHHGDYKNIGPEISAIEKDIKNNKNIFSAVTFGLYYDNPLIKDKSKLRSAIGCVVPMAKLEGLEGDYKIAEIEKSKCVVTSFPLKGFPSYMLGVVKVYPVLSKYLKDTYKGEKRKEFAIFELYDKQNGKIEYIAPMEINDSVFINIINK